MTYILQTETDTRKRPNKCYQKLHICIIYDISSHSTIKIHIVILFPFNDEFEHGSLLVSSMEASSSTSVVWEHSASSVSKCSVVFRTKATIRAEPSDNPTHAYRDLARTWVKTTSQCSQPHQTIQNKASV